MSHVSPPWPTRSLSEIAHTFSDGDWIESKDQSTSGVRLLQTGNVGEGKFKERGEKARFISADTFERLNCTEVFPDDILMSRLPDPVGRACIVPDLKERMITAVDCTIVRLRDGLITPKFFVYFTQSDAYLSMVSDLCTGTTRSRISRTALGRIEVPIPPLDEQKRIVAMLDEAFAALDRARANAEENHADAERLFDTSVSEFLQQSRNDWESGTFGDLVGDVSTGPFGSLLHKSDYIEQGTPIINPSNIMGGKIEPDWTKTVSAEAASRLASYRFQAGDLVVGRRGEMGRCAPVLPHMAGWLCGTGSFIVRPKELVSSEFVAYLIRTPEIVARLSEISTGTTMQNLSNSALADMPFELPHHDEQVLLVNKVKVLESTVQSLRSKTQAKMIELSALRQSLLQAAFSGQLS